MRIVGGKHRGRRLAAPDGDRTRPTTDRTREAVFNILAHSAWVVLEDARVADVFCGTGALGLEALSRGASRVVLIDEARAALAVARLNVEALGETDAVTILKADATRPPMADAPADLIFLDPPYRRNLAMLALTALQRRGWVASGTIAVVEEAADVAFTPPDGFLLLERRCYGDTAIYFVEAAVPEPEIQREEVDGG